MKYKMIVPFLMVSVLSITSCGSTTDTSSAASATTSISTESNTEDSTVETSESSDVADMPVMANTDVKNAERTADLYGFSGLPESDQGNGLSELDMTSDDYLSTLFLDYSSATNELVSGELNITGGFTDDEAAEVLTALASVMCPSDDSIEVSGWVALHVDSPSATTTIGDRTYMLSHIGDTYIYMAGVDEKTAWVNSNK